MYRHIAMYICFATAGMAMRPMFGTSSAAFFASQRMNALKYHLRTCWFMHGKIQKHSELGRAFSTADPAEKRLAVVTDNAEASIIPESE